MRAATAVTGVAMLAVGLVAGFLLAPGPKAETAGEKSAPAPAATRKPLADEGERASVRALRAKVRELERLLAAKAEPSGAVTNASAQGSRRDNRGPDGRREDFGARMARLKTENPARYAQITNNMARWRRQRAEQQVARMEFLSSVDTSRMDAAARGVHESLQRYATLREEIERQLQDESLDEDRRRELREQMHEANRQVWALNGVERENLISETARTLGFEGQDVKDITATMQEIIRATDNGFGDRGGRRR